MKSKRRRQSRLSYKNTRRRHHIKGGEAFASGGYGCVFSPALKCADSSKRKTNTVSKLMFTKNAKSEYDEIVLIKKHLNKIPNFNEYFMLSNITMCSPAPLSPSDLNQFDKCRALTKHSITQHNINDNLQKLSILNMPQGGLPVDDYINSEAFAFDIKNGVNLNNSLMKLITHAIIPMNRANIYHTDIKDSNILVQNISSYQQLRTRIIDWGLAVKYIPTKTKTSSISDFARPFQFNVPFTCIILSSKFITAYKSFLKKGHVSKSSIKTHFVIKYIDMLIKKKKASHFKYINTIIDTVYRDTNTDTDIPHLTKHIISNYISNVLHTFLNVNANIDIKCREYLNNVYIKNVDIWGIILTYYPFLLYLQQYSIYNKLFKPAYTTLCNIFKTYVYSVDDDTIGLEPIDINSLLSDLRILGNHLQEIADKYTPNVTRESSIIQNISQTIALNKSPSIF